jgi:hypothetical protein
VAFDSHLSVWNDAIFRDPGLGCFRGAQDAPTTETDMAHLLRKIAIIGLIAVNSPVHSGKPADAALPQAVRQAAETVRTEGRSVAGSLTAAREAAEILAGMDPALRERILHAAATAVVGKQAPQR